MIPKDQFTNIFGEGRRTPETALDRTTAAAKQIVADSARKRDQLTASLRDARLAREAERKSSGIEAPGKGRARPAGTKPE